MVDEKQPFQAIIDLDNLKWINDNIGHAAGDTLIKTFANALPEGAYRISGDEFVVQGKSREELESALSSIEALLNEQIIELVGDKKTVFKKGIGFSYGIGETLDKAEAALQEHKKTRLAEGKRVERGEAPEGIVEKEEETLAKEPETRKAVIENVSVSSVEMKDGTKKIKLSAPYHPGLPDKAKAIGGRWSSERKAWYFDERDEERVRKLAQEIYGTRGEGEQVDIVTVRVNLDDVEGAKYGSLFLFGREIASRRSRDQRVRLGDGVIIVKGGFPASGGSMRNPSLAPEEGTILEIRDVPLSLVQAAKFTVEIVPETREEAPAEEKEEAPPKTREEAPAEEKEEAPPTKVEKPAVEKPAVPEKKGKDNVEWLKEAAAEARKRIEARKARRGEEGLPEELAFGMPAPGKQAKLPMEDLVDYAIVGAEYIVTKNPSYEDWAELMLEEFGPAIKLFLRGIYGQSQAMLEMTPEEIGEMIKIVEKEVPEDVPDEHGPRALEETSSEDVQGTKGERPTDESGERGGGEDSGGIRELLEQGLKYDQAWEIVRERYILLPAEKEQPEL